MWSLCSGLRVKLSGIPKPGLFQDRVYTLHLRAWYSRRGGWEMAGWAGAGSDISPAPNQEVNLNCPLQGLEDFIGASFIGSFRDRDKEQ